MRQKLHSTEACYYSDLSLVDVGFYRGTTWLVILRCCSSRHGKVKSVVPIRFPIIISMIIEVGYVKKSEKRTETHASR